MCPSASTQALDGYDLMILQAMEKAAIDQVITDNGDYVTGYCSRNQSLYR